jgi:hypothetical protein
VLGEKIRDGSATLWIMERRDYPTRFVEQHYSLWRRSNCTTINLDRVNIRIYLSAELIHNLAVNSDSPLRDELLHLTARAYATLSQKLLQTNLRHYSFSFG